jgi:TonB family protein
MNTSPDTADPAPESSANNTESINTSGSNEIEMVPVSSLTRINYVSPKYPRSAQRRNVTGTVDVSFTVLANGVVGNISILKSTPGTVFDQAAMDAVAQWRFEPTVENGVQVEKRTAIRLAFNLQ